MYNMCKFEISLNQNWNLTKIVDSDGYEGPIAIKDEKRREYSTNPDHDKVLQSPHKAPLSQLFAILAGSASDDGPTDQPSDRL